MAVRLCAAIPALLILLSGCAADDGLHLPVAEAAQAGGPGPAESGTGSVEVGTGDATLRVLVVDEAIRPIAGALVSINGTGHEATTGGDGEALFTRIEPGVYLVAISRDGYLAARAAVTVETRQDEPKPFTVILEGNGVTGPHVQVTKHEFYFYAAYKVGADGAPPVTGVSVLGSDSLSIPDGLPAWLQTEAFWEPRQPLGTNLQISFVVCEGEFIGFCSTVNGTSGRSPVFVGAASRALEDIGYTNGGDLSADVYPSYPPPAGASVFLDQTVTLITHAFYGFEPPPGWRFSADGEPMVPG